MVNIAQADTKLDCLLKVKAIKTFYCDAVNISSGTDKAAWPVVRSGVFTRHSAYQLLIHSIILGNSLL